MKAFGKRDATFGDRSRGLDGDVSFMGLRSEPLSSELFTFWALTFDLDSFDLPDLTDEEALRDGSRCDLFGDVSMRPMASSPQFSSSEM